MHVSEQRFGSWASHIDIIASHKSLHKRSINENEEIKAPLTAACIDAYSTGTRRLNIASGGGLVQSLAAAMSSYDDVRMAWYTREV